MVKPRTAVSRTRRPPTKVPFLEPRSRTTAPPSASTSTRAWRREMPASSTRTAASGDEPTRCSPGARWNRRTEVPSAARILSRKPGAGFRHRTVPFSRRGGSARPRPRRARSGRSRRSARSSSRACAGQSQARGRDPRRLPERRASTKRVLADHRRNAGGCRSQIHAARSSGGTARRAGPEPGRGRRWSGAGRADSRCRLRDPWPR